MRGGVRAGAAWTVPVVCVVLLGATVLFALQATVAWEDPGDTWANVALAVGFSLLGALVVSRRPGNRLGRLYLVVGLASALTLFVYGYAHVGLIDRPGTLPGAGVAGWVSSWIWVFGLIPVITLGLLLYPDGRLPSRRWQWVVAVAAASALVQVAQQVLTPGPLPNHHVGVNPLGIPGAEAALAAVGNTGPYLFTVAFVAGMVALALRWRCAGRGSVLRRQVSLLAAGSAPLLVFILLPDGTLGEPAATVALMVGVALIPAAIGVAILRHQLYDIDLVLNRSLVYTLLTASVITLYAAVVWLVGGLLAIGSSPVVTAAATGVVAAVVLPLRSGLQRAVGRLMYGDRGDPWAAASRLAARLDGATAPCDVLAGVVEAMAASLRLPYVAVQTADGIVAETGVPGAAAQERFPLTAAGEPMGTLLATGRDRRALSDRDRAVIVELARHAGAAVHAAQLAEALHASRQQLVTAREEERRRLRRDLHDGLGPTLAGVALGLDVVDTLLTADPAAARELIADLKAETTSSIADVRRLVYGLRPPALDEFGLVRALGHHADRLRLGGLEVDIETPPQLPVLSAAIEVAAYRIALEALTNTARHGHARHCLLRLTLPTGALELEVLDDGVGVNGSMPGVGLTAMRERAGELGGRCTVTPAAPCG